MATTDIRKAAILLLNLPQKQAVGVLSQLEPSQLEAVTVEIANSETVLPAEQESVIFEFATADPNALGIEQGGTRRAEALVAAALGNDHELCAKVRQSLSASSFRFLRSVDTQRLAAVLIGEHPQAVALVVAHLPAQSAAEVLARLPVEVQTSIARRIGTMEPVDSAIVEDVAVGLKRQLARTLLQRLTAPGGAPKVAEILHASDHATQCNVLAGLAHKDPRLVREVRHLTFCFEDLATLDRADLETLAKNLEGGRLAIALAGTSTPVRQRILDGLGDRAARRLVKEIRYLDGVALDETENARRQIVEVVLRLANAGVIRLDAASRAERRAG